MLPKIHNTGNPGRPIVSANSHPTEQISELVDNHFRPHVKEPLHSGYEWLFKENGKP